MASPTLHPAMVELCRRYSVAVLPGALTPTEIVTAWQAGADVIKLFPAGAMGGASYLKSLKAPLPHIHLLPTGGVTLSNATPFLEAGAFALGIGAELADLRAFREGRTQDIVGGAADADGVELAFAVRAGGDGCVGLAPGVRTAAAWARRRAARARRRRDRRGRGVVGWVVFGEAIAVGGWGGPLMTVRCQEWAPRLGVDWVRS